MKQTTNTTKPYSYIVLDRNGNTLEIENRTSYLGRFNNSTPDLEIVFIDHMSEDGYVTISRRSDEQKKNSKLADLDITETYYFDDFATLFTFYKKTIGVKRKDLIDKNEQLRKVG